MAKQLKLHCPTCYSEEADETHKARCSKEVNAMMSTDASSMTFKLECDNCNTIHYFRYDRNTRQCHLFRSEQKGQERVMTVNVR